MRTLGIIAAVLALGSAAIWLYRDFKTIGSDPEGSLIVNINTASQRQIETIPGVGPGLASLIIAGRPYDSVDDLIRVSGIGPNNLDGFRPFIRTEGETAKR